MKAALYHRVSTVDQNVTNARAELRAAAKARGLAVALNVEETGSGARNDRPGWQRVLAAVRARKVQAVLVWKIDRAGRSVLDLLSNIQGIVDAGARFIATNQGIEIKPGGDAVSRLMLIMLAGVAEFERALIVERTMVGLARARAEGKRLGRPPALNEAQGLQIAGLRHHGASWRDVATQLGESEGACRRAFDRLAEKGPRKRARGLDGKAGRAAGLP